MTGHLDQSDFEIENCLTDFCWSDLFDCIYFAQRPKSSQLRHGIKPFGLTSKSKNETYLWIGIAARIVNCRLAIKVSLISKSGTDNTSGTCREVNTRTGSDRIDAGQTGKSGVAIKPTHIGLQGIPPMKNILYRRRDFVDARATPRPVFIRQTNANPVDYVIARTPADNQIVVVESITASCQQRELGTSLFEYPSNIGSTRWQWRQ